MITLSDKLPDGGLRGTGSLIFEDEDFDILYRKCPETGDIIIAFEDMDELPRDQNVLIMLNNHDGDMTSEYSGRFNNGVFSPLS